MIFTLKLMLKVGDKKWISSGMSFISPLQQRIVSHSDNVVFYKSAYWKYDLVSKGDILKDFSINR